MSTILGKPDYFFVDNVNAPPIELSTVNDAERQICVPTQSVGTS